MSNSKQTQLLRLASLCAWATILAIGGGLPLDAQAQMGIPYLAEPDDPIEPDDPEKPDGTAKPDKPDEGDASDDSTLDDDDAERDRGRRRHKRRGDRDEKEDATSEGDDGEETDEGTTPETRAANAAASEHRPTALMALWNERRLALKAGKDIVARELLTKLITAKKTAGWPNMFAIGDALARESHRSLMAGQAGVAVELANAAQELAPDRPGPQLAAAHALWVRGGAIGASMAALGRAFTFGWTEPPQRRARFGNLILVLLVGLLVASAVFSVVALYRHARIMVHDVHHLFPIGATRLQTGMLGFAVLLAPVFFRLGIAWTIVWWVTLMGVYYQRRERAGAILVLALLAGTPIALPWATSHLGYAGSRSQDIYLAVRDVGALSAADRIAKQQTPLADELFILGLRAHWSGDLDRAAELLGQTRRAGTADPELYTELGNVQFALENYPDARGFYEMAVGQDPSYVEAQFNLSRVYSAMADMRKSGEAYRRATEIDYLKVEGYKEESKRQGPTFVVKPGAPSRLLSLAYELDGSHERAALHLWRLIGGRVPPLVFAAVALCALVLMVLMGWVRRIGRPSICCPRCGRAACLRCNPELKNQKQCGQCYHAFVAKEGVDPQIRIRKEIEVHRYQARTARIRRVFSLMIAGTGQLLRGSSLRGLVFLSAFTASSIGVAISLDLLPEPVPTLPGVRWLSVAVTAILAILCYGLGLWDMQRGERH